MAKKLSSHRRIKPLEIGLLVVAIFIGFKMLIYLVQFLEVSRPPVDVQ